MKTLIKIGIAIAISLSISHSNVFAEETNQASNPPALILEIDLKTLNEQALKAPQVHTYREVAKKKKTDMASKSIQRAKKALKRITSLRYRKNQKLRALIGKSSYTVQYTHKL
jgi:hypothetical protein